MLHLAQSPDGTTIVSAAADETLRFWRVFGEQQTNCWDIAAAILSLSLLEMNHYWKPVRHNIVIMPSLAGPCDKDKSKGGHNGNDKSSSCLMERSLQLRWRRYFTKHPWHEQSCAVHQLMRTVWLSIFNCSDDRSDWRCETSTGEVSKVTWSICWMFTCNVHIFIIACFHTHTDPHMFVNDFKWSRWMAGRKTIV